MSPEQAQTLLTNSAAPCYVASFLNQPGLVGRKLSYVPKCLETLPGVWSLAWNKICLYYTHVILNGLRPLGPRPKGPWAEGPWTHSGRVTGVKVARVSVKSTILDLSTGSSGSAGTTTAIAAWTPPPHMSGGKDDGSWQTLSKDEEGLGPRAQA